MKKALSLILAILMCMSSILALSEGYMWSEWAIKDCQRAIEYGWTTKADFTEDITREEFCVIAEKVLNALGINTVVWFEVAPFDDTNNSAVWHLYGLNIVEGKGERRFAPDDLITREEAATIIQRMYSVLKLDTVIINDNKYADHDEISQWAREAVYSVKNLGIMEGTDKGFEPKENFTYEQAFATLLRLYDKCEKVFFEDRMNLLMPEDKNYMFSPLSIKMALSLAVNGAEGETKDEICDVLGINDINEYNVFVKDLIEKYSKSDKIRFDVANSIWINRSNTNQNFSEEYKSVAGEFYKAETGEVTNSDAVKVINNWISDKTNGKIQGAVKDSNFWAMIVNAIYFKGMWEDKFSPSATKPDKFTNADGSNSEIDFMNQTDWISYADTGKCRIVSLPYKTSFYYVDENGDRKNERNNDLSADMYIIMADDEINVRQELDKAYGNFKNTYMNLSVPKFEVEYSAPMGKILKDMGMEKAFSTDAEFGKMFDKGNMFLTDVIHKTYIKVDEEGTEAAAITAIPMAGSARPPEPVDFKVDKPFYFVVKASGEILFMGRYAYAE